jgi:serine/threonine protein kinase
MQPAAQEISTCPICGGALDETSGGGLGCMVCLLRFGIGDGDLPQDLTPNAFGDERFGVYEIERHPDGSLYELGRGAMGVTYRAIDTTLRRKVALKIIKISIARRSANARERFMREARAAAALRHENIATVFQFGICEQTGQYFYAMELIEGETLEERVRRTGPLDVLTTIDIALQVAAALAAAEERGLVHRDLKPSNLMLVSPSDEKTSASTQRGGYSNERSVVATALRRRVGRNAIGANQKNEKLVVKIIDFGVAKTVAEKTNAMALTHGGFVGTPAFASPEQFTNSPVDVRSDMYSLGATLWFLLTGHMLFSGGTIEEMRDARRSMPLPIEQLNAARIPRRFIGLLISMLAIEPAARPAGAHELGTKLQAIRAQITSPRKVGRRLAVATAIIALAAIVAARVFHSLSGNPASPALPEKSIAVLPFENLSEDKANAYFTEGIQDEILSRLSKIADLKVISRTSTQHYKSAPENLREIAKQLGVAHILEGSVQKSGDTVRVSVQLIKAANDSHLWAETFDRKLTDIFSVESEVAKTIAEQLRAKLTGQEEQVLSAKPTDNTEAYDAYLRGLAYTLKTGNTPAKSLAAQKYLREAVGLDPKFALSWALLSWVDARGYLTTTLQPTVTLREEARQAAETALTLQPNLGEAVLAKGFYHYSCLKDYDTAMRYFEQARHLLPNSSRIPESMAYVARRRGQWDRSESYFNEAERLDPRNVFLLTQHTLSYKDRRLFPEALRKLEQILNITPDDVDTIVEKVVIAQAEGDLPRASALLAPLHLPADDSGALETEVYQAILERRPAPVIPRLKEILAKPDPALGYVNGELRYWLGWAQEVAGDRAGAQETWRQARGELESFVKEQPENHFLIADLALTNMGLGDKAAALALAERAMAANPIEKDAVSGSVLIEVLARVAAQIGEPGRAIAALQKLLSIPHNGLLGPLTPALLRLDPMFDPLRGDPRFQELCKDKQP